MTRKDFQLIARVLHQLDAQARVSPDATPGEVIAGVREDFADALERRFPNFDADIFLFEARHGTGGDTPAPQPAPVSPPSRVRSLRATLAGA